MKGSVSLSDVQITVSNITSPKGSLLWSGKTKYEFEIVLQNGSVLELSCEDATEREEWVNTLKVVVAYLRKVLTSTSMAIDGYDPVLEDNHDCYNLGDQVALNCQAFGPGLFGCEAGQKAQFVVQVIIIVVITVLLKSRKIIPYIICIVIIIIIIKIHLN